MQIISKKIFTVCCKPEETECSIEVFLEAILSCGIRPKTDSRLKSLILALEIIKKNKKVNHIEDLTLNYSEFHQLLQKANYSFIEKIFSNNLVIPEFESLSMQIRELFEQIRSNKGGKPASYIPQLGRVCPDKWGLSICTVDGQRLSIGDVNDKFTIQSTSKPITYALCLEELGEDIVHKYQGREPSGRMFNEIALDRRGQPHNPLVNSGAIMSSALLLDLVQPQMNIAQKYDYVFNFFKKLAGDEFVGFNNAIFLSERDSADRNNALAYYMRENMCFPPGEHSIPDILDFYFQTCSLEMTCDSNSIVAGTLANGGVCPISDQRILTPESVRDVLSLMLSCGLYNYSGDFAFKVGLPGKSGVSGALVVIVPNVMGITLWSPPLDEMGNSVRAVQFCEELVKIFNFNNRHNNGVCKLIDPTKSRFEKFVGPIATVIQAAVNGDETTLQSCYQQGIDLNLKDYDGRTPLHFVASMGHIRCVKFLIEIAKVKVDCKDRWGRTPLDEAIFSNQLRIGRIIRKYSPSSIKNMPKTFKPTVVKEHPSLTRRFSKSDNGQEAAARTIQLYYRGLQFRRKNSLPTNNNVDEVIAFNNTLETETKNLVIHEMPEKTTMEGKNFIGDKSSSISIKWPKKLSVDTALG